MNCDLAREKLLDALYGELPRDAGAELHNHLSGCDSCRQEFDALKQTSTALDSLPAPGGRTRVGQILRRAAQDEIRGARRWRRAAVAAIAASLLIAAFAAMGMRIEVTPVRVTLYFGELPVQATAPQTQPAMMEDPWPAITQQANELELLDGIVLLVAGELQTERQRQHRQLAGLRRDTAAISRELALRWALLRKDVDDMYAFQYPPDGGQQGDQP